MMTISRKRIKRGRRGKRKNKINPKIKEAKTLIFKNRKALGLSFAILAGFLLGFNYIIPFVIEQLNKIPAYLYLVERVGHIGTFVFIASVISFLHAGFFKEATAQKLIANAVIGIAQTISVAALVAIYCFEINHFGDVIPQYGGVVGNQVAHGALHWSHHFSGNYVMAQAGVTTVLIITGLYNGWILPLGRLVTGIPPHIENYHNDAMQQYKPVEKKSTPDEIQLEKVLQEAGINAKFANKIEGNTVTQYEFAVNKNISGKNTAGDIARVLGVNIKSLAFLDSVDGKPGIAAIQAPNKHRTMVKFSDLVNPGLLRKDRLNIFLGRDINGNALIPDLAKMPHLLVAGASGSGKSVAMNTMICSLLRAHKADTLKMVMIDPKMLELTPYSNLPHLLQRKVITDMDEAGNALEQCVNEMERRYSLMSAMGVRKIADYNEKADEPLPYIAIIIDEFTDLMMTHGESVEDQVIRLGQKARAAGIHMIIATQRPDADVITGKIKANIPARIAFACADAVNSKIILDTTGAEGLLGNGDGLFVDGRSISPTRFQGAFIEDGDINKYV